MGKDISRLINAEGKITIAALDHRGSLKKNLHPENPEATTDAEIREWKQTLIELYKDKVSGILIDPIFGKDLINTSYKCGWMLSMEKTGYRGGQEERKTEILENWSVAQAKEMGAVSVKLLLYYDPDNQELAEAQREVARGVAEECGRQRVVFLLEPLTYKKSPIPFAVERMVDDLLDLPVDIFKLEYPGTKEECGRISQKLKVPWVLLSAGAGYEQYKQQLQIACESGAAGMAVGRAAWQEFGQYEGEARAKFFREVAGPRMDELVRIVNEHGKSIKSLNY